MFLDFFTKNIIDFGIRWNIYNKPVYAYYMTPKAMKSIPWMNPGYSYYGPVIWVHIVLMLQAPGFQSQLFHQVYIGTTTMGSTSHSKPLQLKSPRTSTSCLWKASKFGTCNRLAQGPFLDHICIFSKEVLKQVSYPINLDDAMSYWLILQPRLPNISSLWWDAGETGKQCEWCFPWFGTTMWTRTIMPKHSFSFFVVLMFQVLIW